MQKPKQREITLPKSFRISLKNYLKDFNDDDYIFLKNNKIKNLSTEEIKKIAHKKELNIYQMYKRVLKKTKIKDVWNFSLHNIRKTTGMWLKAINVKMEEICFRLGHDQNTYLSHYGSADRFEHREKIYIMNKFKGVYGI